MYIKIRVTPESAEERLVQESPESFDVSVRERARGGAANARVLTLLRQHFKAARRLYIVSGHHSPHKIVSVD